MWQLVIRHGGLFDDMREVDIDDAGDRLSMNWSYLSDLFNFSLLFVLQLHGSVHIFLLNTLAVWL